jgi:hypothetical protein
LSTFNRADVMSVVSSRAPFTSLSAFVGKVWFADAKLGFVHRLRVREMYPTANPWLINDGIGSYLGIVLPTWVCHQPALGSHLLIAWIRAADLVCLERSAPQ